MLPFYYLLLCDTFNPPISRHICSQDQKILEEVFRTMALPAILHATKGIAALADFILKSGTFTKTGSTKPPAASHIWRQTRASCQAKTQIWTGRWWIAQRQTHETCERQATHILQTDNISYPSFRTPKLTILSSRSPMILPKQARIDSWLLPTCEDLAFLLFCI